MPLRRAQVTDFRCLHQAELELDPRFTLIHGPNASGKTSVLEALYLLGRGRSFRTRRLVHVIRSGAQGFRVVGEMESDSRRLTLGVEGTATGLRARLGGEAVGSLADLAAAFPVQIIDPEVHRLIEEGPNHRRRFLDWGVFHVEPTFIGHWRKYHQVLRQRNSALRSGQPRGLVGAWDAELVRYGERVHEARTRYVELLAGVAATVAEALLELKLDLQYRRGWSRDHEFADALERSWGHDQELRATQVGPHRGELAILLGGVPARDRISRGQQKLLAAVLLIAQIKLFPEHAASYPTLLLDDPAAELDAGRLSSLIAQIRSHPLQLVVTTLQSNWAELSAWGEPGRVYRLDQGRLQPD